MVFTSERRQNETHISKRELAKSGGIDPLNCIALRIEAEGLTTWGTHRHTLLTLVVLKRDVGLPLALQMPLLGRDSVGSGARGRSCRQPRKCSQSRTP